MLVFFLMSVNLLACFAPSRAETQIIYIVATEDATVKVNNPDINYGSEVEIKIWKNLREDGFLFFNISSIMKSNFTSAMLRIEVGMSTATTVQVYPANDTWDENTITWNNAPSFNSSIECSATFPVSCVTRYINVTSIVKNWTAGLPNYGFYLRTTINGLAFHSKEASTPSYRPTLEIDTGIDTGIETGIDTGIPGFDLGLVLLGMIGGVFLSLIIVKRREIREF